MPVAISMPKRKDNSQIMGLAGQAAGTAIGGPLGGAVGGAIGRRLGSPAGGSQSGGDFVADVGTSAMQRRLDAAQNSNPLGTVSEGLDVLKQATPELQKQYAPNLIRAQMMVEKSPGQPGLLGRNRGAANRLR